jgi:TonB family protein
MMDKRLNAFKILSTPMQLRSILSIFVCMKYNLLKLGIACLLSVLLSINNIAAQTTEQRKEAPKEEREIITMVEQMPDFPGGPEKLYEFIQKNLQYPKLAFENNIEGKVILQFVINQDGKIDSITQVGKKAGWGMDEEAFRLVKSMPNWMPGKQNGKPVNVLFTLPILFKLD